MMEHRGVILITGISSGIGRAAALLLRRQGYSVYGGARRLERMADLETEGIRTMRLDVTDEESMKQCVTEVERCEGRIDVLINNAGYGAYGAVETLSMDEARRQLEVNLIGMARMVQLVLPLMRKQGRGRIINVSSMAGKVHTAYGAWYHASKFAVEGWSDCLRLELKPFGIDVIMIEPGLIRTAWDGIATDRLRQTSVGGPYEASARRVADTMDRIYRSRLASSPEVIARTVLRAVKSRHPRDRYLKGFMARPAVLFRRLFPISVYDFMVRKVEKI